MNFAKTRNLQDLREAYKISSIEKQIKELAVKDYEFNLKIRKQIQDLEVELKDLRGQIRTDKNTA